MKRPILFLFFTTFFYVSYGQTYGQNAAIQIEAKANQFPYPSIKLTWRDDLLATKWTVYKKSETGIFEFFKTVQSPDTSFTDLTVKLGKDYTYLIHKEDVNKVLGFGLITAGVKTMAIFNYGSCLVMVEDSVYQALKDEIDRYIADINQEGWSAIPLVVSSKENHFSIKSKIQNAYTESDSSLTTVVLIGKIAVPYSGYIVPDGHNAFNSPNRDHQGAWAADVYYADIDGIWTDKELLSVNSPERIENKNVKSDGKFDQSFLPSDADLMLGRIYLEKFRSFEKDRFTLYKRYFDRNHAFRVAEYHFEEKAIVNDDFVTLYEGFSGFGYRNFSTMFGRNAIENGSLAGLAVNSSYLTAFGCGPGDYFKSGSALRNKLGERVDSFKISQTSDYFNYEINCGFNVLFGSYFGDWDSDKNLLRAPLAGKSPALATFWAGRPLWHINEFAHGLPIGFSTRTSQNSDIHLFDAIENLNQTYERMVHVALMGDPTIKLRHIKPLEKIEINTNQTRDTVFVKWPTEAQSHSSYYIFRKSTHTDSLAWQLLVDSAISGPDFTDENPLKGGNMYRIWPVALHKGFSGSYEILGQFAQDSISQIKEPVGQLEKNQFESLSLYPNPAKNLVTIAGNINFSSLSVALFDINGKQILVDFESKKSQITININGLPSGVYFISIHGKKGNWMQKLMVN